MKKLKTKTETESRGRTKRKNAMSAFGTHGRSMLYVFSALSLAAMVAAAFLGPRLLFDFQDSLRCRNQMLEERESLDVTALETIYEKSLYKRLLHFSEGLDSGEEFYVTVREMEADQEFYDRLYSEQGIYQEGLMLLMDAGIISYDLIEMDFSVTEWKQCVIYSNDYTQGVNFMLWYVELQVADGAEYKLLLDADSGELYGVKCDYEALRSMLSQNKYGLDDIDANFLELIGLDPDLSTSMWDAGTVLANVFGGLKSQAYVATESQVYDAGKSYNVVEEYPVKIYGSKGNNAGEATDVEEESKTEEVTCSVGYDKNKVDFYFPYGENRLCFRMAMLNTATESKEVYYPLKDVVVGFPEIYELIDAFNE